MYVTSLNTAVKDTLPPLVLGDSLALKHTQGKALSCYLAKNFGIESDCVPMIAGHDLSFRGFVWHSAYAAILSMSAERLLIRATENRSDHLLIPIKGHCVISYGGRCCSISARESACLIPRGRWQVHIEAPFSGLIVRMNQEALARMNPQQEQGFNGPRVCVDDLELCHLDLNGIQIGSLIESLGSMIDTLLEHPSVLHEAGLETCFNRIVTLLLRSQRFSLSNQSSEQAGSERLAAICRYIDNNLSRKININDLVELSDLSARTIQYLFQKNFGCTPKRYIINLRLKRARELLLGTKGCRSVTQVATTLQFSNLGKFSRLYKEAHGELPSQTIGHHL